MFSEEISDILLLVSSQASYSKIKNISEELLETFSHLHSYRKIKKIFQGLLETFS